MSAAPNIAEDVPLPFIVPCLGYAYRWVPGAPTEPFVPAAEPFVPAGALADRVAEVG